METVENGCGGRRVLDHTIGGRGGGVLFCSTTIGAIVGHVDIEPPT